MKIKDIKQYWSLAAKNDIDKNSLRPTARDPYLQTIVENSILKFLFREASLIDIGCGDGISSLRFAQHTKRVLGLDYIPKFVSKAKINKTKQNQTNIDFEIGDVLNLSKFKESLFDIAITIRCLINLSDFSTQALAIQQIASIIKPGGLYLLSEGWAESFDILNLYRKRANLEEIKVIEYNCLIRRNEFENEVKKYFNILHYENFGLYLYISRIIQPLFTNPEPPSHLHKLNQIAAELLFQHVGNSSFLECDYAGLYVLIKK